MSTQESERCVMRRLVAVPLIVPLDRLYVNVSDDTLKIDQCHAYAGRVGRSLMSLWSSTHNRTRVMTTIQRLVQDTYRLVSRCATRLDPPYILIFQHMLSPTFWVHMPFVLYTYIRQIWTFIVEMCMTMSVGGRFSIIYHTKEVKVWWVLF